MDLYQKISVLGSSAQYDTCGPKDFGKTTNIPGVYHAKVGGTRVCRLFKVLQTNYCQNNCQYCAFCRDRSCLRVSAGSEEMAKAFDMVYRKNLVDGLFLSSGIFGNPDTTMTKLIDTALVLRKKYKFRGYLHLKIMPGASLSCINMVAKLANRISLNIESPTEEGLTNLSPEKKLKQGFFYTLSLIKKELKKLKFSGKKIPSLTTQFIVGAGEEKDRDFIKTTHFLYKNFDLRRVFYSGFRPVANTPFANQAPSSPVRENRLYQADFLIRFYRFLPWDFSLDNDGNLFKTSDPKFVWAKKNQDLFPISLNKAGYWDLLRIPGIGPLSAKKIIVLRKHRKIKKFTQLASKRILINKLKPFVCF